MTSLLPPREIQARIRAGETPEDVATAAQTTVEKVLVYAGPVLDERAHVAGLALAASVRPHDRAGGGPAGTLEELVDGRLRASAVHSADVAWDAWKRPDGRWQVVADVVLDGVVRRATFVHDLAGRYVSADDDLARWLVGETSTRPGATPVTRGSTSGAATSTDAHDAHDAEIPLPPAPAEQTMRSVHPGDLEGAAPVSGVDAPAEVPAPAADEDHDSAQLTLGDDAIALVTGRPQAASRGPASDWRGGADTPAWLDGTPPAPPARSTAALPAEHLTGPVERTDDDPTEAEIDREAPDVPPPAQDVLFGEPDDAPVPATRPGRRRGRASIPSWDEIMFGGPADGAPLADGSRDDDA